MTEPLDPVTAGLVAVLERVRKRAGLQADRLAGTDLDTLAGLDRVRELAAGNATQQAVIQAVIQAVKDAAGALEPTYSIVADVSLGLGLAADVMPDPELYAPDLGRRRTALLANWDRLHELRSGAPGGLAPTIRTLRLKVETDAFSALASALTDAGRRTSPWAQPGPAGPAVTPPGDRTSGDSADRAPSPLPRSQAPLLADEFRRIAAALRDALVLDADGPGWPHDLRKGSKPVTALSTSYGLRTMLLLEGSLAPDVVPAALALRNGASPQGGYAARAQLAPRPEVTAVVLGTLHRIDGTADFSERLAAIKKELREFEKTRPFILTCLLEASVQLGIDPGLTRSLSQDLLAARRSYDGLLLWPEKAEPGLAGPLASIAHTARAVRALTQVQAARAPAQSAAQEPVPLDAEIREAVDQAARWLVGQQDLSNASEIIDRQLADRVEQVYVRHFTAAWVVRALVSVGLPASHPSVSNAVARVWADYSHDAALWSWSNGDLPVWMTLDAVDALQSAALATTIRPVGFGVP
jgi:hypothetical protein